VEALAELAGSRERGTGTAGNAACQCALPTTAWIGYLERMESAPFEIIRCPPQRVAEALAMVLSDIAPSQRREIARGLLEADDPAELVNEPLYAAMRGERLCGAAWGQRQAGNVALFWPPQLAPGEDQQTVTALAQAVVRVLDDTAIEMTQALLPSSDASAASILQAVGFRRLAELLYMSCEAACFPAQPPGELEFEAYSGAKRDRLTALVEQTYEQTLDCVALNGRRTIDEVINGYQSTGVFRPENWRIVRGQGQDVGVLLLAEHPQAGHWELMYMGLVPAARGRRWGPLIAEYAKWLERGAGVERIVLAVDAANTPALRMYRTAGFEMWDRRLVYVRFPDKSTA
jgi:ribosomal protein S18 acetylase RimI-like enzyme